LARLSKPGSRALAIALGAACGLFACSKNNGTPNPMLNQPPQDGSSTGLGGAGLIGGGLAGNIGSTGAAGAVDAGVPSGSVVIAIQSPMAGVILSTNAAADVVAKVTIDKGPDVVDPSSVRVALVPAGGTGAVSAAPLVGPTGPAGSGLFSGKLSLAGLATGDYTLIVAARSSTNLEGSSSVNVKLDAGPKITVLSPIAGHHYKGSIIVQVLVDGGLYPPATILGASIAGIPISLQAIDTGGLYRAAFDLTSPQPLTGDQIFEVSAKDSNPNNPTTTDIKFVFNVDLDGPTIAATTPAPGTIVGQVVRISAAVSDPAGVDASTVQVLIGDKNNPQFKLPLMADATGAFSALFDSRQLTSCKLLPNQTLCIVRPTLSFRAADLLGNETTLSYEIALDNIPPVADLVPPPIRVSKLAAGVRCSFAFDPLSRNIYAGDAPDDGCLVPQMFDLRARIEDAGNYAAGIKQIPISGIDPDVTAAYVLNDTSQPLVVDSDGDGNCDIINPKLIPTTSPPTDSHQVLKVRMRPVPPAGAADFRKDDSIGPDLACAPGEDTNPPLDICDAENPTVAISYIDAKTSTIWAVEPIAPDDPRYCFGSQLDTKANNIQESGGSTTTMPGWRCIAVATADMNGNLSTSAPIRVWVDYKYGGLETFCAANPGGPTAMPSCTGTYDKATDTVSAKACATRNFKPRKAGTTEVCFNNICDFCADPDNGFCD
jgi:hypothetical protein